MEKLQKGVLIVIVTAVCINMSEGGSAGPGCYSCDLVDDPSGCMNKTQCAQDEMCYVHEFTTYGVKRYRMGCVNRKYCGSGTNPVVGRRQTDNHTCSVCCNSELCNAATCGTTGSVPLNLLSKEDSCSDTSVDTCAAFGQLNKDACSLKHVSNVCPRSCSICEHFRWGTWGSWGKCSRTCNPGLRVRYRKCEGQLDNLSLNSTCLGVSTETDPCLVTWCHTMVSSSPNIQGHSLVYLLSFCVFVFLNKLCNL